MQDKKISAGTRLGSMILDHIFMTMICMLFFIPTIMKGISGAFTTSHEPKESTDLSGPLFYLGLLGFALYFCKDCINGRSPAKRIIKLQVVDNTTGQVASPIKCFVRNIFCILWPVEVIVTLVNPNRRIGDIVAGTKIVYFDPISIEQPKVDIKKLLVPVAISYGLSLLSMLPFHALRTSFPKVNYIENSYNDSESKSLEKLYNDSLGKYLTASVKVYDKIENQNVKYISVIYKLKENYLSDEGDSKEIRRVTMQHLYTMFPENTFTGQAQYVYSTSGSMQTSNNQIGTQITQTKR